MRICHYCLVGAILLASTLSNSVGQSTTRSTEITLTSADSDVEQIIAAAADKKDLNQMRAIGASIDRLFRTAAPERFVFLSLSLSSTLTTSDFRSMEQYQLASSVALAALQAITDRTPLATELELAVRLRADSIGAQPQDRPAYRRELMARWVHAMRRLNDVARSELNEVDRPRFANRPPPGFENSVSVYGGAPQDPEVRKRYDEAVASAKAKADRYYEVQVARERVGMYQRFFEDFVVEAYSKSTAPADLEELRGFLRVAGISDADQVRINKAVLQASSQ